MEAVYRNIREVFEYLAEFGYMPASLQYPFVVNALICALLIGPVLGGLGPMVITKRLAFFSQAIGHAALTGVAIGIVLNESYTAPYVSMFSFCILFGLFMNFTRTRTRMASDTIIGVFLSISLAVGACLLLLVTARVNVHILDNVLFGSILTVNDRDISVLLVMVVGCAFAGLLGFNQMLLASFNPALAQVRQVRVRFLDYLFIVMITVLTVASVKIVGAILVEALLLIPAATARNVARSIRGFVFISIAVATISCVLGIVLPLELNIAIPSGGAIILVASAFFFASAVLRMYTKRFREAEG